MAGNDVSIKFAVDGESKFKTAVAGINSQIKNLNSQLNLSMTTMASSGERMSILTSKSDALKQKVATLSAQYDKAKGDLDKYVQKLNELQSTEGASDKEIAKANEAVMRQTKAVNDLGTALNTTKIDLNKCTAEIEELGAESNKTATGLEKFGNTAGLVAEKTATLSKVATGLLAGVVALGTKSVKAYAEYEQLIGGVETLFGESAKLVEENANKAFKTAGISANQYMETVTSFSASLLQSLGGDTKKSAEIADMALIDMADNANKMGTSMDSIQNAYQGFAKQNYTMLDNLKLGYGGTKQEMERLLADAEKLTGVKYNISNLADVYNAIHAIQTELGITGTTAKEAESTISGSIQSLKASFDNLLAGVAKNGADMEQLTADFVEALKTALGNIVAVIGQIFENLPLWAKLALAITGVVAVLSPLASAISSLTIILPALATAFTTVKTAVLALNLAFLANPIVLITAGIVALTAVLVGLYHESDKFRAFVDGLFETVKEKVTGAIDTVKSAIETIKELPDKAKQWGKDMIDNFIQGIKDKIQAVKDAVSNIANTVKDYLGFSEPKKGALSNFHTFSPDMVDLWTEGVYSNMDKVKNASASMANAVAGATTAPMTAQNTAVNALGSALNGMVANQSQPIELTLNIDGKQFARATYNSLQSEGVRQGGRLTTV